MFKTNRKIALAIFVKFLNLSPEIAESVYDGIVPSFTDYGYNPDSAVKRNPLESEVQSWSNEDVRL